MTKIIKMSLVAAVAVAGLTTTSSAAKLADSIKNTDLTGYVRYRYTNTDTGAESNQYRIQATIKSKVNDKVTAKIKLRGQGTTTDASGDADPVAADIQEANFVMNLGGTTVIAGKQALATPFADPDDQQGTGIVAVKPINKNLTIAAGFYTNTDAHTTVYQLDNNNADEDNNISTGVDDSELSGNNIAALAVIGKVAMVNYAVWYANIDEQALDIGNDYTVNTNTTAINTKAGATKAGAQAINANLKAKFSNINVELNFAQVNYSLSNNTLGLAELSPSQTRLVVSSKISKVTVAAGLVVAGKDGGDVTLGDPDAKSNFEMEAFTATALTDTNAYYLMASAPVGPVTAKLEYGATSDVNGADTAGDTAFSELKLSVAYKMSKNFNVSAWATSTSGDTLGTTDYSKQGASRVEVKYTF